MARIVDHFKLGLNYKADSWVFNLQVVFNSKSKFLNIFCLRNSICNVVISGTVLNLTNPSPENVLTNLSPENILLENVLTNPSPENILFSQNITS